MPDPIVPQEDIETPAPAPDVEEEDDDELGPEVPGEAPPNETPEQKDARIAALTERNGKLWARLQRAKKPKPASPPAPAAPVAPAPAVPSANPGLSKEEAILFAKGFSEEEVEHAKKVATLEGVKLTEAVTNTLFTTWKTKRDEDEKQAKAQLPVSRGSRPSVKKTLATPGLSDEDHKALALEKLNK